MRKNLHKIAVALAIAGMIAGVLGWLGCTGVKPDPLRDSLRVEYGKLGRSYPNGNLDFRDIWVRQRMKELRCK